MSLIHPMARAQEIQPARQATLQASQVLKHLMWHKALVDDEDDSTRFNEYIQVVMDADEGEHVSIHDPFHRDLAIAFELVIQEHMDPWNLDLSKFSQLYLQEARNRGIDLVTAGRIILMAWTVLKLQSDEVAERAMTIDEPEDEFDWEDMPDFAFSDDEWDYTERIQQLPQAPIDEKIRHKGDRRVTLMELVHAFEEVHQEARDRATIHEQRRKAQMSQKRKMRGRVGGMMHREDLEAEIAETWHRILEHPSHPIPFSELVEPLRIDRVQTFNALLFLVKSQRVRVTQEDFPHGEIWLTPVLPEASAVLEEAGPPVAPSDEVPDAPDEATAEGSPPARPDTASDAPMDVAESIEEAPDAADTEAFEEAPDDAADSEVSEAAPDAPVASEVSDEAPDAPVDSDVSEEAPEAAQSPQPRPKIRRLFEVNP